MSNNSLDDLVSLLALERIEYNLFRGESRDLGWGRVFGGQVAGQALSAAAQTVPDDRFCHSLHSYFLRGGDPSLPIVYEVDRIRDGKSFTTRRVVAVQKGQAIFNLAASFQIIEDGYTHQDEMPDVPGPEGLKSGRELAEAIGDVLPAEVRAVVFGGWPIEIRPVEPYDVLNPTPRAPLNHAWFKAAGPLSDSPMLHQYMLTYASDFQLLGTTLYPHGVNWMLQGMQVASLDHAMWFHRPFRFDDWLLYSMESPTAAGARGFGRGSFYTRDGVLVASVVQEGLIRRRDSITDR